MLLFFRGVRVAHLLLLLCMYHYYLITLCSLLYVSAFHVWSLSLGNILLISARILVPLITLPYHSRETNVRIINFVLFMLADCQNAHIIQQGLVPSIKYAARLVFIY